MINYSNQLPRNKALDGFLADGCYFLPDNFSCFTSSFFDQWASRSRCEEVLLAKLIKTDELAFSFGQNLSPFPTELGNCIYLLLGNLYGGFEQYEFSVFQQRIRNLLQQMNLNDYPWTGVPTRRHHHFAADEMSLANGLVIKLRKELLSRGYKSDLVNRKKIRDKQLAAIHSMLTKIQASTEGMYLRRFDFYENTGSVPVSLEETCSRWSKFLQKVSLWMSRNSHLGYVWRRELIPEVGFRYHFILCSHVDSARDEAIEQALLPAWQQHMANSQAQICLPIGHRGNGNAEIASRHAPEVLLKVLDSIRTMLDGEQVGRLKSQNGLPNWGSQDLRGLKTKQLVHGGCHG